MRAPLIHLLVVLSPILAGAEEGDRTRAERLDRGEVLISPEKVDGSDVPKVTAEAVVDAPAERLWAIIADCGRYAKTMPRIAASKLEKREGNVVHCRVTADMPFPLSDLEAVTRGVERIDPGRQWAREWTLVRGDYNVNSGRWRLTPWRGDPARTLVRYEVHADPKLPVPRAIIEAAQESALPDLFKRLGEGAKVRPGRRAP